jgi:hypothetical protein
MEGKIGNKMTGRLWSSPIEEAKGTNVMRLPDFICPGPIKCGTTQLYEWLKQHPHIFLYEKMKELDFFNNNFANGVDWYSEFFADCREGMVAGDISPTYFHHKECPERMKEIVPDVKLIFILRNPVVRIYSQYKHFVMFTGYRYDFDSFLVDHPLAIEISLYSKFIEKYLELFSKEQVYICLFEELVKEPRDILAKIYAFLGVQEDIFPQFSDKKVNESKKPRSYGLFIKLRNVSHWMKENNLSLLANSLSKNKLVKNALLKNAGPEEFPVMSEATRAGLVDTCLPDIEKMSGIMNRDLIDYWQIR